MKIKFNPDSIYDRRILLISNMYNSGFSSEEISEYLKLKLSTIERHIETGKSYGFISDYDISKIPSYTDDDIQIINTFLQYHSNIFSKKNTASNVTFEQLADVVKILGYPKKDISMLIRFYCNHKQYEEAINLIYNFETANELSSDEKKECQKLKQMLRELEIAYFLGNTNVSLDEK